MTSAKPCRRTACWSGRRCGRRWTCANPGWRTPALTGCVRAQRWWCGTKGAAPYPVANRCHRRSAEGGVQGRGWGAGPCRRVTELGLVDRPPRPVGCQASAYAPASPCPAPPVTHMPSAVHVHWRFASSPHPSPQHPPPYLHLTPPPTPFPRPRMNHHHPLSQPGVHDQPHLGHHVAQHHESGAGPPAAGGRIQPGGAMHGVGVGGGMRGVGVGGRAGGGQGAGQHRARVRCVWGCGKGRCGEGGSVRA